MSQQQSGESIGTDQQDRAEFPMKYVFQILCDGSKIDKAYV